MSAGSPEQLLPPGGPFIHALAVVESTAVGVGTRIWAFAHVLPRAIIGADCNICDHTFIENDVVIGNRVTVKCGVQLWDGVRVEDDVFIGPNATFTNDPLPRSKQFLSPDQLLRTTVKRGASIGANATVLPGITVGERAVIGAGAVVTRNVPSESVVVGNPARIVRYVNTTVDSRNATGLPEKVGVLATTVRDVSFHRLPSVDDLRGHLSFGEVCDQIPFEIKRYFIVYGVPTSRVRGEHAHRQLHQFLICVHGSCHVVVDDGTSRQEFVLDDPSLGLHIPPMVWTTQYKHSNDAVLLVFASAPYDNADCADDRLESYLARQNSDRES